MTCCESGAYDCSGKFCFALIGGNQIVVEVVCGQGDRAMGGDQSVPFDFGFGCDDGPFFHWPEFFEKLR